MGWGISVGVYRSELSVDLKQSSDSAAVTTLESRAGAIPAAFQSGMVEINCFT